MSPDTSQIQDLEIPESLEIASNSPDSPQGDDADVQVMGPPRVVEPRTATSSVTTSPIALAIRDEIHRLAKEDVLSLDILYSINAVARDGRALLAARNPISRFDNQASVPTFSTPQCPPLNFGEGINPWCQPPADDYPHWNGSAVRGARKRYTDDIQAALADSPLANAVRDEILGLTAPGVASFDAAKLLEIEQLSVNAHRILSSALGLPTAVEHRQPAGRRYGGAIGNQASFVNPTSFGDPYSSAETYGATALRELIAKANGADPEKLVLALAKARELGMEDVAAHLEAQLGVVGDDEEGDD